MAASHRDLLRENLPPERISTMLDELMQLEKPESVEIQCKHCRRSGKYEVNVADRRTALEALKFYTEQGYGKAGATDKTDQPPDLTTDPAKLDPAARRQLAAQLLTLTSPNVQNALKPALPRD